MRLPHRRAVVQGAAALAASIAAAKAQIAMFSGAPSQELGYDLISIMGDSNNEYGENTATNGFDDADSPDIYQYTSTGTITQVTAEPLEWSVSHNGTSIYNGPYTKFAGLLKQLPQFANRRILLVSNAAPGTGFAGNSTTSGWNVYDSTAAPQFDARQARDRMNAALIAARAVYPSSRPACIVFNMGANNNSTSFEIYGQAYWGTQAAAFMDWLRTECPEWMASDVPWLEVPPPYRVGASPDAVPPGGYPTTLDPTPYFLDQMVWKQNISSEGANCVYINTWGNPADPTNEPFLEVGNNAVHYCAPAFRGSGGNNDVSPLGKTYTAAQSLAGLLLAGYLAAV